MQNHFVHAYKHIPFINILTSIVLFTEKNPTRAHVKTIGGTF